MCVEGDLRVGYDGCLVLLTTSNKNIYMMLGGGGHGPGMLMDPPDFFLKIK